MKRMVRREMIVLLVLGAGVWALSACRPSESATAERTPGELAFRRNCQSCHSLPRPKSHSDQEWPALVARYGARAHLTSEQVAQIAEFLLSSNGS